MIKFEIIDSLPSTNARLREMRAFTQAPYCIMALEQTAGRGQRGNVWLSTKNENILCSILWAPTNLKAIDQFALSQAVCLAICNVLKRQCNVEALIKWPNDIYVGNKKLAGILIENSLKGSMVQNSIIGIGLNLNQAEFHPSLPNPVSVKQLTDIDHHPLLFLKGLLKELEILLPQIENIEARNILHKKYLHNLWRMDGLFYPFIDRTVGAEASRLSENPDGPEAPHAFEMTAVIEDVTPTGYLHLRDGDGILRVFAFKEVEFVL